MATAQEQALIDATIARNAQGEELNPLLFWGHTVTPGWTTQTCLSQWFPADFEVDGVDYTSAEQFMMAGKARLFNDHATLALILDSRSPRDAKRLGRRVQRFDPVVWEGARFGIVVEGSYAKFGQNPDLRDFLLGTGDRLLVEASPVDTIWGIGLDAKDARARDPRQWKGLNLLGFALMEARSRLRAGNR